MKKTYDTYDPELLEYFSKAGKKYRPRVIRVLIVAESPPPLRKGRPRYFYFDELDSPENLYHGIMTALWGEVFKRTASNKPHHLKRFCEEGFYLIDAVKFPIYDLRNEQQKIQAIREQRQARLNEILALEPEHTVLIHPYVFAGLYEFLLTHEISILNASPITFPIVGKSIFDEFISQFQDTLARAGIIAPIRQTSSQPGP